MSFNLHHKRQNHHCNRRFGLSRHEAKNFVWNSGLLFGIRLRHFQCYMWFIQQTNKELKESASMWNIWFLLKSTDFMVWVLYHNKSRSQKQSWNDCQVYLRSQTLEFTTEYVNTNELVVLWLCIVNRNTTATDFRHSRLWNIIQKLWEESTLL